MKKSKQGKKEKQNIQFEEKKAPGNLVLEPRRVLKEIREGLQGNRIKGAVPSGQDTTQISFQLEKRECLKNFLSLKCYDKTKLCKCNSRR